MLMLIQGQVIRRKLLQVFQHNLVFWICLVIFGLLLARNPFSQRTLIAVMDPFPDSIDYTNSAFSMLHGQGFMVVREGRKIVPNVPPLYSISLIPFFALSRDVRTFYFTNVVLGLIAFGLFYRIVRKIFPNTVIQFTVLFLYVVCLPLSWYPTLAMSENLILPLFLLALNLVIEKYSLRRGVALASVSICFYATKYASLPLLVAFILIYLSKIWQSTSKPNLKLKRYIWFGVAMLLFGGLFEIFEFLTKGTAIITTIIPLFLSVFVKHPDYNFSSDRAVHNEFFSTFFILQNLRGYTSWLLGSKLEVLWGSVRIMSPMLAIPACFGLLIAPVKKQWRILATSLVITLVSVIGFLMTFYTTDGRYFWNAIPTLILGFGFVITFVAEFIKNKFSKKISLVFLVGVLLFIVVQNLSPVKSAIMLNLKHAETPWPYISILRLNSVLKTAQAKNPQQLMPLVITPLSPYYVDYFATEKMTLLPLSQIQDEGARQPFAWGNLDFANLHQVYTNYLMQNHPVYFASYGIGNVKNLQAARADLSNGFVLKLVDQGCENVCNIYQLQLK